MADNQPKTNEEARITGMPTNKNAGDEPDQGRLIGLNISFLEYALLSIAIDHTMYAFHEKLKREGKFTDKEDQARVALTSLEMLIKEQVVSSTSGLSPDRLKTNIANFLQLRDYYQEIVADVWAENLQKNIERITGAKL